MILSVGSCRFLGILFIYRSVYENVHEDKIGGYSGHGYENCDISCDNGGGRRNKLFDNGELWGDIRVDDGRRGSKSKETIHFYSHNIVENVGGNWRG